MSDSRYDRPYIHLTSADLEKEIKLCNQDIDRLTTDISTSLATFYELHNELLTTGKWLEEKKTTLAWRKGALKDLLREVEHKAEAEVRRLKREREARNEHP